MSDKTSECLVVFTPSGKRGRFRSGTPLLDAARELGVDIDSVCGGRGICGRCKCLLAEGEFAKFGIRSEPGHLSPISEPEKEFAHHEELLPGYRLTCHATVCGDVVIDVPAESQVHHQVVRKPYESRDLSVNPHIHLHYVEVSKPRLDRSRGDLQRLLDALQEEWQLVDLESDPGVLSKLQACLRDGDWHVTAAVRDGREIVAIWPGFKRSALGIAVDVGSTTVAAHLCDLTSGDVLASAGVMNPQIRFGEDLMSRVSYVMLNPDGNAMLTEVVREAVNSLIGELMSECGSARDDVLDLTFVGNPVMHHLLLGINPVELGRSPFALATDQATTLPARNLDLDVASGARAYVLPCIAGHVGADTAAMLLAEAPWESDAITLLVDVGTNAEIVLGGSQRLLTASSPTGPAFEGAQISCGQRAAPGAIERVRIDPVTLEPRFKVIGCDLWSDEAGFEDQTEATGITGVCGTGIIEAIAELYLAGVIAPDGRLDASAKARSARVLSEGRTHAYLLHEGSPALRISQTDVRAIQLAKGALYAGIRVLMNRLGVESVDRIRLAGAFGAHIDVKYAMVLGMIPDCALTEVSSAGNAAGTGAIIALLDTDARALIEERVLSVEKIETAVESAFQDQFVKALAFPHACDRFPELAKHVTLPETRPATKQSERAHRKNTPRDAG